MVTTKFETRINAPIEKVWIAITNTTEFNKWMPNMAVETDWKEGAAIIFTCNDENGNVIQWNGMDMIWEGVIEKMVENQELTCTYPSKSTGLVQESHILTSVSDGTTQLNLIQTFISQAVADGYKEGNEHTFQLLKKYLENI